MIFNRFRLISPNFPPDCRVVVPGFCIDCGDCVPVCVCMEATFEISKGELIYL